MFLITNKNIKKEGNILQKQQTKFIKIKTNAISLSVKKTVSKDEYTS